MFLADSSIIDAGKAFLLTACGVSDAAILSLLIRRYKRTQKGFFPILCYGILLPLYMAVIAAVTLFLMMW